MDSTKKIVSPNFPHETGLLRSIVQNIATCPLQNGPVSIDSLRAHGIARGKITPSGLVGILDAGFSAFSDLSEKLFFGSPLERGTTYEAYQDELLNELLRRFNGTTCTPSPLTSINVKELIEHLNDWFNKRSTKRDVFIPCMISPWKSPRFSIGPVTFIFVDDISVNDLYPQSSQNQFTTDQSNDFVETMRRENANWLAIARIEGCDQDRAIEIGNHSVDLAIVALQLAAPKMDTKNMSRLSDRRGPVMQTMLSASENGNTGHHRRTEPGLCIGEGTLQEILSQTTPTISAVGNIVLSYATGSFRLQKLEQAWCDASYWLHQGLAEPLDSIAVTKLETSIEVLLHAQKSGNIKQLVLDASGALLGLTKETPIWKHDQTTVEQFATKFSKDRSKILHGTKSTLSSTLITSRSELTCFATTLIRSNAIGLDAYANSQSPTDDVSSFLAWVKQKRVAA